MKIKYLLFSMLCIITSVICVSAKENVAYEWGEYYANKMDMYQTEVIQKDDAYYIIAIDYNNESLQSKKFNAKTGEVESSYAESVYCSYGLTKYNDEIICVNEYEVYILDEKLNIKKEVYLSKRYSFGFNDTTVVLSKTDNQIVIWDYYYGQILTLDCETGDVTEEALNEANFEETLGDYAKTAEILYSNWGQDEEYYDYQKIENKWVISYADYSDSNNEEYNNLKAYDDTGKKLFDITLNNEMYWNYLALEDKVLVIELVPELTSQECRNSTEDTCSSKATLKVYDYEGQLQDSYELQEAISDKYDFRYNGGYVMGKLIDTKDGFLVLYNSFTGQEPQAPADLEETIKYYPAAVKYHFTYDIETKTDGNGTIESIPSSKSGETVTFKVTPKEGYTIDIIKVTDKDGNVITITKDTFTMPSADVLIEATFKKEVTNPNTFSLSIMACLIFIVISLLIIRIGQLKMKWLNE